MITDELLFRYLNDETNKKEDRFIQDWLSNNTDHQSRLNSLKKISEITEYQDIDPESTLGEWEKIASTISQYKPVVRRQTSLVLRISRIAAVFIFLLASGLIWFNQTNTHVFRNGDLLTKSIILPDGTHVDLGPGSKLSYGKGFRTGERLVKLTGEAFFDVTSDPNHPFTVVAGLAKIKVTGTRFVVNAPVRSQEVEVSVKSGNVLFYNSETMDKNSFRMGLVAGEKGVFYPSMNRMDKTIDPYFHTTP